MKIYGLVEAVGVNSLSRKYDGRPCSFVMIFDGVMVREYVAVLACDRSPSKWIFKHLTSEVGRISDNKKQFDFYYEGRSVLNF